MATTIDVSSLPNRFLKNILKLKVGERDLVESIAKLLVKTYGEATGTAKVTKKKASKKKASKKKASKKKASKKKASKKKASKKKASKKKASKKVGKRGRPRKKSEDSNDLFAPKKRNKKRHAKPKLLGDDELIY